MHGLLWPVSLSTVVSVFVRDSRRLSSTLSGSTDPTLFIRAALPTDTGVLLLLGCREHGLQLAGRSVCADVRPPRSGHFREALLLRVAAPMCVLQAPTSPHLTLVTLISSYTLHETFLFVRIPFFKHTVEIVKA